MDSRWRCEQAFQQGSGEAIPVSDEVLEMACCDAQHIGQVKGVAHVGENKPKRATQVIPPAVRRLVMKRDDGQCVVDGCSNATFVDVHHLSWDGTDHDIEKIAVCCSAHHKRIHAGTLSWRARPQRVCASCTPTARRTAHAASSQSVCR